MDKNGKLILVDLDVDTLMQNNTPALDFYTWAILHDYFVVDKSLPGGLRCIIDRVTLHGSMKPDPVGEERDWEVINMFKNGNIPYFFMPPRNFDISKIRLDEDSEDE